MSSTLPPAPAAPESLPTPGQGYGRIATWFDIAAQEHRILEFWQHSGAFNRLRQRNAGAEPFSFLDGPITANNPMGVHHAWGRTFKDAYQRYHAMNGRDQRYQNGFDCQGLWVEVEVEKQLGFSTKAEIEAYGIDRFVKACMERVRKYSSIQTAQSVRLGQWMDWDNSYFTMSDENNYTIWSFLKKCHQRGKIYRGHDVMPWSGRSGSAYSHMEVIEGRKLVAHIAVFLRFPLRDRPGENLLVWTTTPWTLTSNVAAAVNTELAYARLRAKRDGQIYYFAAENLEFQRLERQFRERKEWVEGVPKLRTIAQIFNELGGFTLEGSVPGSELVGLAYDGPFDELDAQGAVGGYPYPDPEVTMDGRRAHRVIDGGKDSHGEPVVVAGEGTGIVHIAPGCGDIDHQIGRRLGLPALAPLDEAARFLAAFGPLAGRRATDPETVDWILTDLRAKGLLVATEPYPHIYPHCWRTGDELVFRLVDEWYIRMDWRDEIKRVVDDIRWIPAWGRERELEWLTNMQDWMISKKRFWGLALPIWVCPQCEHFEVIGGREELQQRAVAGWAEFDGHSPHRPWIDAVKIACEQCGATASRVPDVGNPWLDAGIVPYSTTGYNRDRQEWARWIPADLVLECFPGQFRNWFYSLLAMSTMMEGIAPFRTLKGHALVRDEHGQEMHKSSGNAIWFDDAAEQAGADTMRWAFVRHEPTSNLNFGYTGLREIRGKFLNTLWNTHAFYVNYARIAGFHPGGETQPFPSRPDFDRWILTRLQATIERCRASFEDYTIRQAALAIEEFLEDLSNWYIRNNRRRFWQSLDDPDCRSAFETLYECVLALARLTAPMVPFLAEAIYQNTLRAVDAEAPLSVHLQPYPIPNPGMVDETLAADMAAVTRLNRLALSAREGGRLKVRQPLARLTIGPADEVEARAGRRFSDLLAGILNVKEIVVEALATPSPLQAGVRPNLKMLGPKAGSRLKDWTRAIAAESARLAAELRAGAPRVCLTVGDEAVSLEAGDLLVEARSPEGLAAAEDGPSWVAFDARLTPDLLSEGRMRDMLRNLQVLRKEEGLEIEDRIHLAWDADTPELAEVFHRFEAVLADELLAVSITRTPGLADSRRLEIDGSAVRVAIRRATGD